MNALMSILCTRLRLKLRESYRNCLTRQHTIPLLITGLLLLPGADHGAFAQSPLTPLPDGWLLSSDYSDEFSGDAIDSGKWEVALPPWGQWTWKEELTQVADGVLRLGMSYELHERDGEALHYRGGIVRTLAEPVRYGYFEARIRAASRWPGVATAFWLFLNSPEYWTEIDVVEMMQRRSTRSIVDHSAYVLRGLVDVSELPVRQRGSAEVAWDPSEDFHIYGCLWTAEEIRIFVDGELVAAIPNQYWHRPMDVVFSVGLRQPLTDSPSATGFPTWAEFDYLRVWQAPQ